MNKFILLVLTSLLIGCANYPNSSQQETPIKELYFTQKEIPVRVFPSEDSPIVVKAYVNLGDRAPIYEERNKFYRVTPKNTQIIWVEKASLCDGYACWLKTPLNKENTNINNKATSNITRKASMKDISKKRTYSSSSCPCNSSNICIGPRGGQYCITSGGNKRYLR